MKDNCYCKNAKLFRNWQKRQKKMDSPPLTYSVQWRNDSGEVVNFYENRYLLQQFLKIIFAGKSHHCHFFSFIFWSKHQLAKSFEWRPNDRFLPLQYSIAMSNISSGVLPSKVFTWPIFALYPVSWVPCNNAFGLK